MKIEKCFKKKEYSSKCDIYSLGVAIYILLFGAHPYILKMTVNFNFYILIYKVKKI